MQIAIALYPKFTVLDVEYDPLPPSTPGRRQRHRPRWWSPCGRPWPFRCLRTCEAEPCR